MPDLEKVINGLRHCTAWAGLHECQPKIGPDCPYEDEADCKLALMRDALTLLKEQEEQIKNRDESLEKAREEIKWLRGMMKEQEAVVRCRYCKRRGTYDCPVYVGGDGMCSEPDDWFCADGERKETERTV